MALAINPKMATASIKPLRISGGSANRRQASTSTSTATPKSSTVLITAAKISSRYQPNVRP